MKAKFITPTRVGICRSNQKESRSLYLKALKKDAVCNVETFELNGRKDGVKSVEETLEVTRISASLATNLRSKLIEFLQKNNDVFP